MESATFNSIVHDATHTRAVSLAAIPLSTDVGDPDDIIPVRGVYQPQTHTISDRRTSLPLDLIDDTRDFTTQQQYNRLYPTLPSFTPPQGMYAADQVYTARRTLYLTARGDTTNPNPDLPMAPLSQDEHYVSDAATQQDGVPQVTSDTLALPLPYSSNLPTDYDQPHRSNQPTSNEHTVVQPQITTIGATAQQNTGETFSVPSQEGRYRDIVQYTNGSQLYDVVQQLEALLIEYGPTNVTVGNFMFQAELDAFFRDGKEADFSSAPNVLDSLVYLDRTYYQYETEIDFPHLHIDCDSAEEEDLEDTLPYEEPPPPYHSVRNNQMNAAVAAQHSNLHVTTGRQSLLNDPLQAQVTNLPQLDGPLEGTKQYVSAATSPLQWQEYPLNSAGS